jgi:steroid 5-alpha reductase family enzyme
MTRARLWIVVAYAVAFGAALFAVQRSSLEGPLWVALWADVVATGVIFAFSLAFRNSSFYDAYWSVAPLPIAWYWALNPEVVGVNPIRLGLVMFVLALWGARLTWNWTRGWTGLDHEDWRYVNIQAKTGALYWPASFFGIHLMPTLWVFLALLPVFVVMTRGLEPFGYIDILAFAVTLGAIWLEARADKELMHFRASKPGPEEFLQTGVWSWSRHPNYLGEMGFWWGLWLFGMAADPSAWWTIVGPVGITLMFRFVSLPMIETRMAERRPAFAEYATRSSLVLPRFGRRA